MLVIRFFPVGKKDQPSYKIVVTDKRRAASRGRFVEEVGFYNPLTKEKNLNSERIKHWLSVGAQPSDTVHNMLVRDKIIEGKARDVHKKVKEKKGQPAEGAAPAPKTATPEAGAGDKLEEKPAEEKQEELKAEEAPAPAKPEEEKEETPKEEKVEEKKEEKPKEPKKEEKTE